MKFPKKFMIAGDVIGIKLVDNLKDEKGEPVDGKYSSVEMIIYLDKALKPQEMAHTFFHEFFHALCDSIGTGNCEYSHDLEEIHADNLGKQLSKIFNFSFKK